MPTSAWDTYTIDLTADQLDAFDRFVNRVAPHHRENREALSALRHAWIVSEGLALPDRPARKPVTSA